MDYTNGTETRSEYELDRMYRDMLDECYGDVEIAGLTYSTSHALQTIDPVAYRCGFSDWLDADGWDEMPA